MSGQGSPPPAAGRSAGRVFRAPWFWLVFGLVALAATAFAVRYFGRAFPIVSLELAMDRAAAMDSARSLALERGWGPDDAREAASFGVDFPVQTYVELEAGGTDAFRRLLAEGIYEAYTWEVRRFRDGVTREVTIRFTPSGRPYGFVETLSEDAPGPAVTGARAREIAEATVRSDWPLRLEEWELVEQGRAERPGGRVDHTLVFEGRRLHEALLGEGRLRLRLVVSGDRLTELTRFVEVPEAFQRRYEEMRSANRAIGVAGFVGMIVFLLGGVASLGVLAGSEWVLWRPAAAWGAVVSGLMALATWNEWPLYWMGYDTAVSAENFVLQHVVLVVAQFLGLGLLYFVTFITAETLSRRAFPRHPRLWEAWNPRFAATPAILGRTVAGYLLIGFFWAYEVGLYFLTRETLGWWNPSSALFHPDALATWFPWLSSIALSLQAGFWEECLFRAVPLAAAALIGDRVGGRRLWIAGALVLQALVFGAGHASYAAQPAYARVAELVIPSLAWGFLYLAFGLLPAIVLHFAIDVSAFAVPLFVSTAPGARVDQAIVLVLTLTPLWVVLLARWRRGRWSALPGEGRNGTWNPPELSGTREEPRAVPERPLGSRALRGLATIGAIGLGLWLWTVPETPDAPPLRVGRERATAIARGVLEEHAVDLDPAWRRLPAIAGNPSRAVRYVWREEGAAAYEALLGRYLDPPHWEIRFARFEGDVAERAEEYEVFVDPSGASYRFRHQIPEARPGPSLEESAARELALQAIRAQEPGGAVGELEEISAIPVQRPARRDWTFTLRDPRVLLGDGEARVVVEIAGDVATDLRRLVHVPEEWARAERDRRTARLVGSAAAAIVLGVMLLCALVVVARSRSREFSMRAFLVVAGSVLVLETLAAANAWPQVVAGFSTAQPFELQVWAMAGVGLVFLGLLAVAVGVIAGLVHGEVRARSGDRSTGPTLLAGLALGFALAGGLSLAALAARDRLPIWGSYSSAGSLVPWLQELLGPMTSAIELSVVVLLGGLALDRLAAWRRGRMAAAAALVVAAYAVAALVASAGVSTWLLTGSALAVVAVPGWILVLRRLPAAGPVAVAGVIALHNLSRGWLRPHPAALPASIAVAVLLGGLALVWLRGTRGPSSGARESVSPPRARR